MTQEDSGELENENARLRRLLEQAGVDAAASDVASKLQKLLIAELHHRIKNLLSMVLSITSQTMRSATSLEAAQESVQNRIMILSRSFELLAQEEMDGALLEAIIENACEPYNETHRIAVEVPRVSVSAQPALSLALVFNELCTNALKHGALSGQTGAVEVRGGIDEGVLLLRWAEQGGPPVQQPSKRSFGTTMISSVLPEAQVALDFQPSGLLCQIKVPIASLSM